MEIDYAQIAGEALGMILLLSLLPLLASLIVGLVVSLFQALTQIQEQTLTFVPKIIATILVIIITAAGTLEQLQTFSESVFDQIINVSVAP